MADQVQREEDTQSPTWLWSWGAGTHGQLASGAFIDHLEPLPLPWFGKGISSSIDHGCCPTVLDMAGGGAHAVAVLGSKGQGQVVTWGNGQSGALGHGDDSDLSVPKIVEYFQGIQICSVAAGWSHSAFVANSGELYTCGNGSFGQLGHGDFEARFLPSKVKALPCSTVVMAACGMRHTLVLAHGQEIYAFGSSKRGQLGIGPLEYQKPSQHSVKDTGKVSGPRRIIGLMERQIVLVAANGDHSAALSETGLLYLWGRGFDNGSDILVPAQVGSRLRFSQVALGWNHCIALADGQLWAWGSNQRGQLGILQFKLGKTQDVPTAADAAICTKHDEGIVVSQDEVSPNGCQRMDVLSAAVLPTKHPVTVGIGSCANGPTSENHWPKMLRVSGLEGELVKLLSAGAEHSAIVLEDGRIMTWGWGEHGQLGLGTVEDQLYPDVVAIPSIPLEGKLKWRPFCGSGFTFAVAEQCTEA